MDFPVPTVGNLLVLSFRNSPCLLRMSFRAKQVLRIPTAQINTLITCYQLFGFVFACAQNSEGNFPARLQSAQFLVLTKFCLQFKHEIILKWQWGKYVKPELCSLKALLCLMSGPAEASIKSKNFCQKSKKSWKDWHWKCLTKESLLWSHRWRKKERWKMKPYSWNSQLPASYKVSERYEW